MNDMMFDVGEEGKRNEFHGRSCSEEYSCVEDMFYFLNLAIPFIN
jgi:hypothetical protein